MNSAWKSYLCETGKKSRQNLAQDLRDAFGPSVNPSTVRWSLIRNGLSGSVTVKKPFLKKAEVCQIIQGLDWKSMATSLMKWLIWMYLFLVQIIVRVWNCISVSAVGDLVKNTVRFMWKASDWQQCKDLKHNANAIKALDRQTYNRIGLSRAQTLILLNQCGIIMTENSRKCS